MNLFLFLFQVFIISLSGALQPGPVTAAAITLGAKNRWAGVLLAIGHGIVEFPLMILIILGLGSIFQKPAAQITIGLLGGTVLLYMAFSMFKSSSSERTTQPIRAAQPSPRDAPWGAQPNNATSRTAAITAGIILTASNPYFLIWWATVGLALATRATQFGLHAFVLFTITHWLVDLLWVTALSLAAFHGTSLLGPKPMTIILKLCAAAMLFFAVFFLYSSISLLLRI